MARPGGPRDGSAGDGAGPRLLPRRRAATYSGSGLALLATSTLIGRGSLPHAIIAIALVVWIAPVVLALLLALLAVFFYRAPRGRWLPRALEALLCIALGIGCIAMSYPAGLILNAIDMRRAERYYDTSLIPVLEEWKEHTGTYPRDLAEAAKDLGRAPRLVSPSSYDVDGTEYTLVIHDPASIFGGRFYSSTIRAWIDL